MNTPLISVIIATYNSSHLLSYAIQSVLNSDFQDWELIVVGDCCTDDTEAVVREFSDPRIHFYNLEKNSGQQATPNNFGMSKAKGQFIAFLNQDDLFFSDHLSKSLEEMQKSNADFLIVPGIKVLSTTKDDFEQGNFKVQLCSVHPDGRYSTNVFSVASTWFFRSELIQKLGPWKMEKDLYITPSQEWIFRASRLGITFHFPFRVGVLVILSGERKNSYLTKFSQEHAFFSSRINDQELKNLLLEKSAVFAHKELQNQLFFRPKILVKRVLGLPLDWILQRLGIHPNAVRNRRAWGKKGNLIKTVRRDTGLKP
jgi:glycosyltransferase involved in cell wall biosynthesis